MLKFNTKLVKVGTSLATIIPQEIRKRHKLSEKDSVVIEIWKTGDLSSVFGKLKGATAKELNDLADEHGWDE